MCEDGVGGQGSYTDPFYFQLFLSEGKGAWKPGDLKEEK